MDGTELLFLSYVKTLKTFTPRRQTATKMKLSQIFMEQEIEQGEEEAAQEYQSTVSPLSTATRFLSPVNTSSDSHIPIIMYASEDTAAHSSSQNMVYENHTAKSIFSTFRPL
jgi:subtilase family serine protease